MDETVSVKPNMLLRLWNWFLRSGERMREEEEEVRELRLEQLRAEEESIEKYGSVKFAEAGEEPERDLRFFEITDRIGGLLNRIRRKIWVWMKKMARSSAAFASIVGLISKRSRERAVQRAHKMAELAASGVDDAGESIFEHLPESWQTAYLTFEDDVVSMIEEKEKLVAERIAARRKTRKENALKRHDARVVALEHAGDFWRTRRLLCVFLILLILAATAFLTYEAVSHTYYEYSYNGRTLGIVRTKRDVIETIDIILKKMEAAYGAELRIDTRKDVSFRTLYGTYDTDSADAILTNLSYLHNVSAYGYAILADGEPVTILETEAAAKNVLRSLREAYRSEDDPDAAVSYREDVSIERVATTSNRIVDEEKAFEEIRNPSRATRVYTVAGGDTFSGIASLAGLTVSELHALNPDVNTEKLKVGQELALEAAKPAVTVITVSKETYEEEIPYETTYVDDEDLYQGESVLQKPGENGSHLVTADVTRENGAVVSAEILSETVLTEPVSQVVLRGSKPVPAREGTGTFIWPTAGYISSKFGMRWGRLHKGIDIARSTGTPIYAADGGTIQSSSWNDSYGYYVVISHGNGISTCYAHCSKLLVEIGEKVYQGQRIALMGSTGNSTGPHCHFEVRINEDPRDPLYYLP